MVPLLPWPTWSSSIGRFASSARCAPSACGVRACAAASSPSSSVLESRAGAERRSDGGKAHPTKRDSNAQRCACMMMHPLRHTLLRVRTVCSLDECDLIVFRPTDGQMSRAERRRELRQRRDSASLGRGAARQLVTRCAAKRVVAECSAHDGPFLSDACACLRACPCVRRRKHTPPPIPFFSNAAAGSLARSTSGRQHSDGTLSCMRRRWM